MKKLLFLPLFFLALAASAQRVITDNTLLKKVEVDSAIHGFSTTATAAGTTTLTNTSNPIQYFTGSTTQTVVLPNATTLHNGEEFYITNRSTGLVTINANGGGLLKIMSANTTEYFILQDNTTSAGSWDLLTSGVNIQVFTSTGANTWTKPLGKPKAVLVVCIGAGGGGGGGNTGVTSTARIGGGGGGGGARIERWFDASDLGSTESINVGAGGTAGGVGAAGGAGGNSTFASTLVFAGGGGGGKGGTAATVSVGVAVAEQQLRAQLERVLQL